VPGATREVVFSGMCDASGAVTLSPERFAVADDEGNVLRVYDANRGGAPLYSVDLSEHLDLPVKPPKKKKKNKPPKPRKAPEVDLEAATRIGDRAYWLTSHARSSSGKLKAERHRFFATNVPREGDVLELVGVAYESLFHDLAADPRYAAFGLAAAAARGPKEPGGFNIEGMTERPEGGVLIGLRNPIPEGKALIVPMLNPEEVVAGQPPRFGDPVRLDLGGLGVRSMSWWRGRYLIAAGHHDKGPPSRLYTWDGKSTPRHVRSFDFRHFNPEAFVSPEERDDILVLSDDGSVPIGDDECKKLKDPTRKQFRGVWVALAVGR